MDGRGARGLGQVASTREDWRGSRRSFRTGTPSGGAVLPDGHKNGVFAKRTQIRGSVQSSVFSFQTGKANELKLIKVISIYDLRSFRTGTTIDEGKGNNHGLRQIAGAMRRGGRIAVAP